MIRIEVEVGGVDAGEAERVRDELLGRYADAVASARRAADAADLPPVMVAASLLRAALPEGHDADEPDDIGECEGEA